jgi:hypothetical protein
MPKAHDLFVRLWLLLLLDCVLLPRRLIYRRGSTHVFVSVFGQYQPSLRHVQEPKPGFMVRGFVGESDALSGVCAIQLSATRRRHPDPRAQWATGLERRRSGFVPVRSLLDCDKSQRHPCQMT